MKSSASSSERFWIPNSCNQQFSSPRVCILLSSLKSEISRRIELVSNSDKSTSIFNILEHDVGNMNDNWGKAEINSWPGYG